MPEIIKCPYSHCGKEIDLTTLNKNNYFPSFTDPAIKCPHCGEIFVVKIPEEQPNKVTLIWQ